MAEIAKEIHPVNIEDELKQSYLDYAMSVIVGRALPDVRDGLKPVHRRILYAMHELSNDWNKPHKKSARIVGEVIGKYHPHGDGPVYDAITRMAQDFSMRNVLIDGQGNFGSIDGDAAAAMRYTEIRMSKIAHEMLADLDKETVDFAPNYDETEFAPIVLPTKVPNLLINGTSGIAVGMATNVPPHNLGEIIDACVALIDNPDLSFDELIKLVPGPDFPTKGVISGVAGIISGYKTGRGRIYVRAVAEIESHPTTNKQSIVVTELPYQVNKARLIEKIAELVKTKRLEGISALRDESDKDGIRVVIEVKKGENADVILNNLYTQTKMQQVFGINMVALVNNQPKTLSLREILDLFLRHRREVVTRRTVYDLRKAKERAHILEGLSIAISNIDPIILLIKSSKNAGEAKEKLLDETWDYSTVAKFLERSDRNFTYPDNLEPVYGIKEDGYKLSPIQAQAILELRLHRLTALEQDKLTNEYQGLLENIAEYMLILRDVGKLMQVIREELVTIKATYPTPRQTQITQSHQDLSAIDLITEEDVVVTLSNDGYVKYQPLTAYSAQKRGGKGKLATQVKEEDCVANLVVTNTHDTVMCFSTKGKVYWLKVFQLPLASRTSRGKPIINLLPLDADERISSILPTRELEQEKYLVMTTKFGTIKKVAASEFLRQRSSGLKALDLVENDELIGVDTTNGSMDIMLFSSLGKVVRFNEENVRAMGRTARGVRGIKLDGGQVISMVVVKSEGDILTATEKGFGKRTKISEYPVRGRGGQGVISIQTTERNGLVVGAQQVSEEDEAILISTKGTLVRIRCSEVSQVGRNTQGVKLINVAEGESLVKIQKVAEVNNEETI